jgi:formylglycine-generating enzyme
MKNTLKKIGFAAIIAVIGLAALLMTGCPPDDSDDGNNTSNQSSNNNNNNNNNGNPITSPTGIVMVSIPAGTFTMGSPTTEPNRDSDETQHSVTLSAFSMSKYQVTQEQYQAVMGSNPSNFSSSPQAGETQGKRPVESVSWYDALVFCNKLSINEGLTPAYSISGKTNPADWGAVPTSSDATWNAVVIVAGSTGYRLPTEAQWEYACRAGTTTAYNTGATISDNTGWYSSNSGSKMHEVGKKPANAWGLHDMHGNVWEWCWDRYGSYPSEAQTNPLGASSGADRVLRGGCWDFSAENLRSAYQYYFNPYDRYSLIGFRLVRP